MVTSATQLPTLEVLRALADPTRHELYDELRRAPRALSTGELADRAGLHPNTVRAHLDQLCEAGLVVAGTDRSGGRGRPRHVFAPSANAPIPAGPAHAADRLARSLLEIARTARLAPDVVLDVGRRLGREGAAPAAHVRAALQIVVDHEARDGFRPTVDPVGPGRWRLSFAGCPHRSLADADPDLVCGLHRGTVEGLCGGTGHLEVGSFAGTVDAGGCHVVLHQAPVALDPDPRYDPTQHKEDPT